jgi:aminoglycoside phosphotransferase (APT) family kinase protein
VDDPAAVAGIDVDNVTTWMTDNAAGVVPPLSFELITGGRSNLTFRVADAADGRWVLRRPPLGHVLATAHDVGREHRIIAALTGSDVPVPPLVGLCTDDAVNGAPFYVMQHVDGIVARDAESGEAIPLDARRAVTEALVDGLVAIQEVDVDAVGLGDLGRREAYVERQLSRWQRQWEATRDTDVPVMDELHARLAADVPEQGPATIVHGDYRLDNCIVGPEGAVRAVLDWELCTLGDPLADVGQLMVYWVEPGDPFAGALPSATTLEGFPRRDEVLGLYAERSGRDLSRIGFYTALGYWKLACILQGVAVRYRAGAMGDDGHEVGQHFSQQVAALGEVGLAALTDDSGVPRA